MAIVTTDDRHYKNIANKIRSVTGTDVAYMPENLVDGIAELETAANMQGYESGYENGFFWGKQAACETIVIAQDCKDVLQAYNMFGATNSPTDKMVLFVNKAWNAAPNADTTNNKGLFMLWLNDEFRVNPTPTIWGRWRDNEYSLFAHVNESFSYNVLAGEEWLRVVIM